MWVLPRAWILLRSSVNVLLEGVPEGVNLDELRAELSALPGVTEVHDLHVWSVTSGVHSLTTHLVVDVGASSAVLLPEVQAAAERHGIERGTVQLEPRTPCRARGTPAPMRRRRQRADMLVQANGLTDVVVGPAYASLGVLWLMGYLRRWRWFPRRMDLLLLAVGLGLAWLFLLAELASLV